LIEHPSVLKTFRHFEALGVRVHYLGVDRRGQIDLDKYRDLLSSKTLLVSVMMANNETGSLFPIETMAGLAHAEGALFHSDLVQAFGKVPFDLRTLDIDYASISAHKFYALKGTGILFCKKSAPLDPLIYGGGQERHRRGGTENTLGIFAMGASLERFDRLSVEQVRLEKLRNQMEEKIISEIPDVSITAGESPRLPNTSSLVLAGVDGETLLMSLDLKGVAVSTGAACSSGNPEPSPVLLAMGLSRSEAQSSLRVSLGWSTTETEINEFIKVLKEVVERLRKIQVEELAHSRGNS
jgi:cysteine desulfurase